MTQPETTPGEGCERNTVIEGPLAGNERATAPAMVQPSAPAEGYLYASPEGESASLLELLPIFFRRRWLFLSIIAVIFIIGMLFTACQQRIYESTCSILVTSKQSSRSDDLPLLTDLQALTQARSVDTQVGILSSVDLLHAAYTAVPERDRQAGFRSKSLPSWAVRIATKKNTDIINITVTAYTPQGAATLANSIANMYFQQDLENNRKAVRQAREYVESRLAEVRREFQDANQALAGFKKRTGMMAPAVQTEKALEQINAFQADIDTTAARAAANRQAVESLLRQVNAKQETTLASVTVSRNPHFSAIVLVLDGLFTERAQLLQEYQPHSREVREIDARIAEEEAKLAGIAEMVVASSTKERDPVRDQLLQAYSSGLADGEAYKAQLRVLNAELANRRQALKSLPVLEQEYGELLLTMQSKEHTVDFLAQKLQTLLISEQSTLTNGHPITTAQPDARPVSPNVKTNAALSLVIGIILALLLVLLIDKFDDRLHEQQLAIDLTGLPMMGSIHALGAHEARAIQPQEHGSLLLERFRVLRNNLYFTTIERQRSLLAVTSVQCGEGKSFCASNLAIAMARDGKRVLLVDGDLHRPSVHAVFQLPDRHGLVDVIMDACALETAIQPSGHEGLSILAAGSLPPNTSEILNSARCRHLFANLASRYDYVILDCPPCIQMSDIQVISTFVDGLLLVVGVNRTSRNGLKQTHQMLNLIAAPLVGLVANYSPLSRKHIYYSYYGSHPLKSVPSPEGLKEPPISTPIENQPAGHVPEEKHLRSETLS